MPAENGEQHLKEAKENHLEQTENEVPREKNEIEWLKEEVRKFTTVVTNPSVRLQLQAYSSLCKVIKQLETLPEPFIKGIVKIVTTACVFRYSHKQSFRAVENLLNALAKHESGVTARSLAQSVQTLFPLTSNIRILKKKLRIACCNKLQVQRLIQGITEVSKEASAAKKMTCLISILFTVYDGLDHNLYLDIFSKSVLFPKTRAEQFVIDNCNEALSQVAESTFCDSLLPNIKKSLLRSPEVAVFGGLTHHQFFRSLFALIYLSIFSYLHCSVLIC
ncbi:unnamed protein product [Strongylus vulgaris]|uniref:Stalled ribosome sensor GCN1-like N-terminal domain-containing protein n=1 Tax=Strongylus vulgaris TaxID=40348 RepID=A0A3P7JFG2_STRVU|nr:unnamed protein product [Strongylus vulgaris]